MLIRRWCGRVGVLVGICVGMAGRAHAGIITDVIGGFFTEDDLTLDVKGPGGRVALFDYSDLLGPFGRGVPNNDNSDDPFAVDLTSEENIGNECLSANCAAAIKQFSAIAPIDIVFEVEDSEGTTEHKFFEAVINDTGQRWVDYHLDLGFGSGDQFTRFGPSGAGPNFDTPDRDPTPTSRRFSLLNHTDAALLWSGGFVDPSGDPLFFVPKFDELTFLIDVPDSDSLPEQARTEGGYRFTLRQQPSVIPEPSSLFLFASGLLGLAGWRRRRPL